MTKNKTLIPLTFALVPMGLIVLQGYHLVIQRPMVEYILAMRPQFFSSMAMPYPFVSSMFNLFIFGALAAVWPKQGFGHEWKPRKNQSVVAAGLMIAAVIYPALVMTFGSINPFNKMGMAIWTITPVQEEIIFRGFLYSLLLFIFKKSEDTPLKEMVPLILIGSVWFSLWHLSPHAIEKYGWYFMIGQLSLTFVAGILFNLLRYWTKSIWLVIPVHAAGNFMLSIF